MRLLAERTAKGAKPAETSVATSWLTPIGQRLPE